MSNEEKSSIYSGVCTQTGVEITGNNLSTMAASLPAASAPTGLPPILLETTLWARLHGPAFIESTSLRQALSCVRRIASRRFFLTFLNSSRRCSRWGTPPAGFLVSSERSDARSPQVSYLLRLPENRPTEGRTALSRYYFVSDATHVSLQGCHRHYWSQIGY